MFDERYWLNSPVGGPEFSEARCSIKAVVVEARGSTNVTAEKRCSKTLALEFLSWKPPKEL